MLQYFKDVMCGFEQRDLIQIQFENELEITFENLFENKKENLLMEFGQPSPSFPQARVSPSVLSFFLA